MDINTELPPVPKNYLCIACGMKGNHWIMKCSIKTNKNKKSIRYSYQLLIYGYCRENENNLSTKTIPSSLIQCIYLYFFIKYKIIGRGYNYRGSLSLGDSISIENWTQLTDLENICSNHKNVYKNCNNIMVISDDGKVYSSGPAVGFHEYYRRFKQIDITQKVILASIGLTNEFHKMIYTENDKLYAMGFNCNGMFGNGKTEPMVRYNLLQIPRFWSRDETFVFLPWSSKNLFWRNYIPVCFELDGKNTTFSSE